MSNSWIEDEEAAILADSKKKYKGTDNMIFIKMFTVLFLVFFYTSHADAKTRNRNHVGQCLQRVEGKTFKCSHCRMNQWHDTKNADWSGRYYCTHCGKEL